MHPGVSEPLTASARGNGVIDTGPVGPECFSLLHVSGCEERVAE